MIRRPDIKVAHHGHDTVGESPLWDAARDCLWWVDIAGRAIRRLDMASGAVESLATTSPPGALALSVDDELIVATGNAWAQVDMRSGKLAEIAAAPVSSSGWRMNDGVVDSAGRFWTGGVEEPRGSGAGGRLFCLEENRAGLVLDNLLTQNGTAFSPDGRTFYLSDSHPDHRVIWAFDFDAGEGAISNRRVFHRPRKGRPDGAAVDAEGCYWFAAIDAGRIVRLDPYGHQIGAIELPVSRPTNLAFAGPDLTTLYVTTMRAGLDQGALANQPLAGVLLVFDAGVTGLPQHRYRAPQAGRLAAHSRSA